MDLGYPYNSIAHFVLGYGSAYVFIILPVFMSYQIYGYMVKGDDVVKDVSEFILGYLVAKL